MTSASLEFVVTPGAGISFVTLAVSLFLAVYVLGMNPKGRANRAFVVLMGSFVLFAASEAVERSLSPETSPDAIVPFARGAWLGIVIIPAALFHLGLAYPEPSPWLRRRWALPLIYLPVLGWGFLVLGTNVVIEGVVNEGLFGPSADVGPWYPVLAVLYSLWYYGAQILFLRNWWRVRATGLRWMQGIVAMALVGISIPAGVTEIFWPVLTESDTRLGLASLFVLVWSISIAYSVARYRYLVIEPVVESRAERAPRHQLERGLNYLVVEAGRSAAMGAFRDIVSATPGLCVTGLAPAFVARRFGLERTPILWVTAVSNGERTVRPSELDFELIHTVVKFLRENPGTAVLLDDLDYLAAVAGFDAVARFLKRVTNQASASKGTVVVATGAGTFSQDQFAILRGSVDRVLEVQEASPPRTPASRDHMLLTITAQDAPLALPLVGARAGLILTTEHPTKARLRYGDRFDVVWVTDRPEARLRCVRPKALDTEGRRAVSSFAAGHAGLDIVIVGLEQLALYVDVRSWLPFVKDCVDIASLHGCRLFLTAAPDALGREHLAKLARRFDTALPATTAKGPLPSEPTTGAPESRIPYRGPSP